MRIRPTRTVTILLVAGVAAMVGAGMNAGAQSLRTGKLIHSFPPTPLFRGVAVPGAFMGTAEIMLPGRSRLNSAEGQAGFEIAIDVIAFDRDSGAKLADVCVTRSFPLATPLDLKKIQLTVTGTGVRFDWPDGTTTDGELFLPGANVEVSILAAALRIDGDHRAAIEGASLRVNGDLDGDGIAEFSAFLDTDYQKGHKVVS